MGDLVEFFRGILFLNVKKRRTTVGLQILQKFYFRQRPPIAFRLLSHEKNQVHVTLKTKIEIPSCTCLL